MSHTMDPRSLNKIWQKNRNPETRFQPFLLESYFKVSGRTSVQHLLKAPCSSRLSPIREESVWATAHLARLPVDTAPRQVSAASQRQKSTFASQPNTTTKHKDWDQSWNGRKTCSLYNCYLHCSNNMHYSLPGMLIRQRSTRQSPAQIRTLVVWFVFVDFRAWEFAEQ